MSVSTFLPYWLFLHASASLVCLALQRFRFSTSLVYAVAVGLEFLTPLAPRYFLLLASVANVGKSVGLATHISTQPSFVRNFARQDNLSDLTAKAQVRARPCMAILMCLVCSVSVLLSLVSPQSITLDGRLHSLDRTCCVT